MIQSIIVKFSPEKMTIQHKIWSGTKYILISIQIKKIDAKQVTTTQNKWRKVNYLSIIHEEPFYDTKVNLKNEYRKQTHGKI